MIFQLLKNQYKKTKINKKSFNNLLILYIKMPRKRASYSLAFKQKIVNQLEEVSLNSLHKKHEIDRKCLREWSKKSNDIKDTKYKAQRVRLKRKSSPRYPELESELLQWILDCRANGAIVDGNSIRIVARQIAAKMNKFEFSCSNGWFSGFLRRSGLVLRRITTNGRELPKTAKTDIQNFISGCSHHIVNRAVERRAIVNMDETCIYLDSFSEHHNLF